MSGTPGSWASDISSAPAKLVEKGVRGFILSSSLGLSGWVIAKESSSISAQGAPVDTKIGADELSCWATSKRKNTIQKENY
jgi:hypothetical protein